MSRSTDPLIVTPLLDREQIGASSIDVRLGNQFIVLRRSSLSRIDPADAPDNAQWETTLHRSQQRTRIATFKEFVLHPGQLALGATLEFISIPKEVSASVEGRSSWGRLGLIVATASTIGPGFKGCVTLELVNSGEVPLILHPGVRIAQIVIHELSGSSQYSGKYNCPVGPEFSRIHEDREIRIWGTKI
jgi:dCTP deaminase